MSESLTGTCSVDTLTGESMNLLAGLVSTPSVSREEGQAATLLRGVLKKMGLPFETRHNNTWCFNRFHHPDKPTILLSSHIDTVKPSMGWMSDPFCADASEDRITGLGSNEAGASVVSLLAAFRYFHEVCDLPYNICFAATAEEEVSGDRGIQCMDDITGGCSFGIIGAPTEMKMAVSEPGLMVVDARIRGQANHAAIDGGVNALYLAVDDLNWIRNHRFSEEDDLLGPVRMTVTMMDAGYQHNVLPDLCRYVIDIRTIAAYSHEELLAEIDRNTHAEIVPRSTRLKATSIDRGHLLCRTADRIGIPLTGSPTLSDQALLDIPTVKMGPGSPERSHKPGEFISRSEIRSGIDLYIRLLEEIMQ